MSVIGDSVINDSSLIVEFDQELYFQCEPIISRNPFPPYDMTALDILHSGKAIYLVEKDTATFLADALDCMELKFLQPDDWDSTDVSMTPTSCPGKNGYYKEIYRRNNFYMCP